MMLDDGGNDDDEIELKVFYKITMTRGSGHGV